MVFQLTHSYSLFWPWLRVPQSTATTSGSMVAVLSFQLLSYLSDHPAHGNCELSNAWRYWPPSLQRFDFFRSSRLHLVKNQNYDSQYYTMNDRCMCLMKKQSTICRTETSKHLHNVFVDIPITFRVSITFRVVK